MSGAGTRSSRLGADEPSAVALAVRKAARFDRSAVSLQAGLVAALPVAGVLAAGTLAGDTVAAAGGAVQVVCCALLAAPAALRVQRSAVAEAYGSLGRIASDPDLPSGLAAAALDESERELASPSLLGDAATMPLSALVQDGRRTRLEFDALSLLLRQYGREQGGVDTDLHRAVSLVRERAADALGCVADVVEAKAPASQLEAPLRALDAATEDLTAKAGRARRNAADSLGRHLAQSLEHHAAALAGQVRAAAGLAAAVHEGGGRITVRPSLGTVSPRTLLAANFAQIRANMSLESPAGRHAVRLAVIVPATWVLSEHIPLARAYWIPIAAATVLRPDFGATFTRGVERMAGTCLGAILAGLVAVALHPTGWMTVALVGILAWGAYSVFPASFAAGTAFLTAMIVFLLEAVAPSTLSTATDRGIDTLVGGAIGLLAYALWPTWSSTSARQALVDLLIAQRDYVRAVLATAVEGRRPSEEHLRPLARRARLAWTKAEATLENSLSEPAARRIDVAQVRRVMTGLRRLIQAVHVIRLDLEERSQHSPLPALARLAQGIDDTMAAIGETLATGVPVKTELPPLRILHHDLVASDAGAELDPVLLAELDEIVDAANTVTAQLGLGQEVNRQ